MKRQHLLLTLAMPVAAGFCVWLALRNPAVPLGDAESTAQQGSIQSDDGTESGPKEGDRDFVGTEECRSCHAKFYEKWSHSWHGLAMRPYTAALARETLITSSGGMAIRGRTYEAHVGSGQDAVIERGPDGEKKYPILHVLGGKNVCYFLTPLSRGRLQVLPLAYDIRRKQWYDAAGSMVRHFVGRRDEAIDWTDRLLTFNAACQGCHVSQFSKNYSVETDSYQTTWREPGINCESCHGPGREHIRRMTARKSQDRPPADQLAIAVTGSFTPSQMNSLCAQCHAKAAPLTSGLPPGESFWDHFRLTTLEDPDFYPDGRDLGENFTYTSWLMSPCAASAGVECMHCHTSSGHNKHAGADADQACAPCHQDQVRDPAGHSHHPPQSAGSRCVACHMPETSFARMRRHDHSMLPPSPAATLKFQSPNACNLCHTDRDAQWADGWVRKWYPRDYQAPMVRRGQWIAAARKDDWSQLDEMMAYVAAKTESGKAAGRSPHSELGRNDVFVASLLRLMVRAPSKKKWPAFLAAIEDPSPLVRAAAAAGLAGCPEPQASRALVAAASDPFRVVRNEAAIALAGRPAAGLDAREAAAVAKAQDEYKTMLRRRPDDPLSHFNLGNCYQQQNDTTPAIAEYRLALRLDPALVPALVNLSMVYAKFQQTDKAEAALREALRHQPASPEANFNMGLLLAELKRPAEAEACLRKALAADSRLDQAAYNLAVLRAAHDLKEAIALCRKAVELRPDEPKYALALAIYLRQGGDTPGAIAALKRLKAEGVADREAAALLQAFEQESVRPK